MTGSVELTISGDLKMHCAACEQRIEQALTILAIPTSNLPTIADSPVWAAAWRANSWHRPDRRQSSLVVQLPGPRVA